MRLLVCPALMHRHVGEPMPTHWNRRQCDDCAGSHQADLRRAGCSGAQERAWCAAAVPQPPPPPPPFFFGAATAAYQIEGFREAGGRQPSVWDAFDTDNMSPAMPARKPNGEPNVHKNESGKIADRDYANFPQTTELLQHYGFDAYRMSLSWTRILSYSLVGDCGQGGPTANQTCSLSRPTVNEAGIQHYVEGLQGLKAAGLLVAVTMWHWDTPLVVEEWAQLTQCAETNQYTRDTTGSAWLCPAIADLFAEYAQVVTSRLDRYVDHWITLNEPLTVVSVGYAPPAKHAPGRCANRSLCWAGNDTIEPYYAAKNMMRAHAKAYRAYDGGSPMGFAANADWLEPVSGCAADHHAAANAIVWQIGLFWDLLATGDWAPEIAKAVPHPRLPSLSPQKTKYSFAARMAVYIIRTYMYMHMHTSNYAWAVGDVGSECPNASASWRAAPPDQQPTSFGTDNSAGTGSINHVTGHVIGPVAPGSGWLRFTPTGLPKLQRWIAARYAALDLKIVVTENGWGGQYPTEQDAINDMQRCQYYRQYIGNMSKYVPEDGTYENGPLILSKQKPTILGYFAWSLLDNYEWNDGYSQRFGITHVEFCGARNDRTCMQKRTPKMSGSWFAEVLKNASFREADIHNWGELPACKFY